MNAINKLNGNFKIIQHTYKNGKSVFKITNYVTKANLNNLIIQVHNVL